MTIDAAVIGTARSAPRLCSRCATSARRSTRSTWCRRSRCRGCTTTPRRRCRSLSEHRLLGDLPAEAIDAFVAVAGPGSGSTLLLAEIRHLGGALGVAQPGHGALAQLDASYLLFGAGLAASPEMIAGLNAALPVFKAAMARWDAGTGYLNFEETAVDSRSFYDEVTHRRLARVKAQVDPRDMFRSNHPIKPATGGHAASR